MQVALLPAVEEDKSDIWNMFVPAMKPHIEKIWGWEENWQTNEFNSRFFELNTSFIVLNENKLGYVQYSLNDADTYLNMVIMSPNYQGQSLGNNVLSKIQGLQEGKPLRLRCFHVNERALKFYKENGFSVIESEENCVLLERHT
ncbi:GNAT family N-acetyltransferase [Reinekea sp. G2M2-21]|uniref:GNAT family N-acetyltransferase n=1 Tax=Reinekea sp. G2M2-21 TaxID=2788942 RepID=UPI0018AC529B|nr:GNAT family N-acetyltransferase [Reinekea sp. G2M2-21]